MEREVRVTRGLANAVLVVLLATSAVVAAVVAVPAPAEVAQWTAVLVEVGGVILTMAAIWLGMLFGLAYQRSLRGRDAGASELMTQLMRPLKAGGVSVVGLVLLVLASPYARLYTIPALPADTLPRLQVFGFLAVGSGCIYGILLALAPVNHIIDMLQRREDQVDALPDARRKQFVSSVHEDDDDVWRH